MKKSSKKCLFCQKAGGLKFKDDKWYHPMCYKISKQTKDKGGVKDCTVCNLNIGDRIKCGYKKCETTFHIRCAYTRIQQIIIRDGIYEVYCSKHRDNASRVGVTGSNIPLRKGRGKHKPEDWSPQKDTKRSTKIVSKIGIEDEAEVR